MMATERQTPEQMIADAYNIELEQTYYPVDVKRKLDYEDVRTVYALINRGVLFATKPSKSWQIKGKWLVQFLMDRSNG